MRGRQIKLTPDGWWHRPFDDNGGDHTACDEPIGNVFATREHTLDTELCPLCFTQRERDTAKMKKLEEEALARASSDAWFDDEFDNTPTELTPVRDDERKGKR